LLTTELLPLRLGACNKEIERRRFFFKFLFRRLSGLSSRGTFWFTLLERHFSNAAGAAAETATLLEPRTDWAFCLPSFKKLISLRPLLILSDNLSRLRP
jgi:hypothetical protein